MGIVSGIVFSLFSVISILILTRVFSML